MDSRTACRVTFFLFGLVIVVLVSHSLFLSSWLTLVAFWFLAGLAAFFSWFIDSPNMIAQNLVILIILVIPLLLSIHFLTYSHFGMTGWWFFSVLGAAFLCIGCMDAVWKADFGNWQPNPSSRKRPFSSEICPACNHSRLRVGQDICDECGRKLMNK